MDKALEWISVSKILHFCLALTLLLTAPLASPAPLTPDDQCHAAIQCYDEASAKSQTEHGAELWEAWQLAKPRIPFSSPKLYRPIYIMVRYSDDTNSLPSSPSHPAPAPLAYKHLEAKFQLSFKSELISPMWLEKHIGIVGWRAWFAYTQQSNWQILDIQDSRPFRNTNYEPEFIVTRRITDNVDPGWKPKLVNFGLLVHQSNGQTDPLSRSWNRTYIQSGWQTSRHSYVLLRIWHRWSEDPTRDDNPDITSFAGTWDALLRADFWKTRFLLLVRHRYVQLDLSPMKWKPLGAPLHFQITSGYGETLLDYNHRQTTLGVGWSFGDW